MAKQQNPLIPFQNSLTGRCIKALDSAKIEFQSADRAVLESDNFTSLKNMKYTDNGVVGVTGGMTKINTNALSSHPKIRSMYQFLKVQPAENHILVHAENTGETESKVFQNTTAIPSTGNFSATALHTDGSGAGMGRFSSAPNEHMAYCNGVETMVWGGDITKLSSFEVYDEFASAFRYDYTREMQNTLTDTANLASFFRDTDAPVKVTLRVGNTLPIESIAFTVPTVNTNTLDDATNVFYWNGSAWAAVTTQVDNTITGTTPNEVTFGQSGTITFDSTATTAKASIINGVFGYFYKIEITGADAATRLSQVTVKEPFQELRDYWDGDLRIASSVQLFQDSIFKDNTVNVFEDSFIYNDDTKGNIASYMNMNDIETSTEYLAIGVSERMQGLQVKMIPDHSNQDVKATGSIAFGNVSSTNTVSSITVNSVEILSQTITAGNTSEESLCHALVEEINENVTSPNYTATTEQGILTIIAETRGTGPNGFVIARTVVAMTATVLPMANGQVISPTLTVKYWNGSAWTSVGTVIDGTSSDSASFGKSGFITWNSIAENTEFKRELNSEEPLYYYQLSWDSDFGPNVLCYHANGIPVQKPISTYKFPLHAQGRLWLFSDKAGNKNQAIVSALGELNVFNGKDSGDPLQFGDRTEVVAAVELFERTSSRVESHILVLKGDSSHIIEGDNPEKWKVINLTNKLGCNAPLTLATSTLGFEFSPMVRRQIAIWQGSSGMYMFDNNAIHPISDDIAYFFDQKNADAINLAKSDISYGFFESENGEQYYHWCFASGSSTVINNEWVFDIKRQKWFEYDRGTGKAIQGGSMVIDTIGNAYNYGFEDNGYLQRLNNGTDFDGNAIVYEMEFGDVLPAGNINILTAVDSVRLATVSKSTTTSKIKVYHYGDTKDNATVDTVTKNAWYEFETKQTGQRVAFPFKRTNTPPHMTHRLKFTISTNNEVGTGFEPLYVGGFYKNRGFSEDNLTD